LIVDEGSVLDADHLISLGKVDTVYAWGVLHHTGATWRALENVLIPPAESGALLVAIYNERGRLSVYWKHAKRLYTAHPAFRIFHPVYPVTRSGLHTSLAEAHDWAHEV
jgi:2-polyprenyl-6-hydroxyphenyl methylase/3-demethylubiquinone-9 3-methyltransferase